MVHRTGFVFNRRSDDPKPSVNTDMSTVYLWGPSEDATPAFFPLYDLVQFNSSDVLMLANIGTGALRDAVNLINAQLAPGQIAARIICMRTPAGTNRGEGLTAMVGDQAAGTGVYGALQAGQRFGIIPRLFLPAGGYTGMFQRSAATTNVTRTNKPGGNTGTGLLTLGAPAYLSGVKQGVYTVRCVGGAKSAASAAGTNTGNGSIASLTADLTAANGAWSVVCQLAAANGGTFAVLRPDGTLDGLALVGAAYNSANGPNFTITDGSTDFTVGDGFTITVADAVPANGGAFEVRDPEGLLVGTATVGTPFATQVAFTINDGSTDFAIGDGYNVLVTVSGGSALANPLNAAMPQVLNALFAHAVSGGPGLTAGDALDWRETITSDRIIPIDGWVQIQRTDGTLDYVDGAAAAIGIGVARDFASPGGQGVPSQSWAYQPVQGIVGLKRYDSFSLLDGATTGQQLFSANVGTIQRGEIGVETAAADSGFVLLAADNAGNDDLWRFYSVTRTRDYTHLQLMRKWRQRLGNTNITLHGVQAVVNDMITVISALKRDSHIIDGRPQFLPNANSPEDIRAGSIRLGLKQEEASPLLKIVTDSSRDRNALVVLISDLAAQVNANIITA